MEIDGVEFVPKGQSDEKIRQLNHRIDKLAPDVQKLRGKIQKLEVENNELRNSPHLTKIKEFQYASDRTLGIGTIELKDDWFSCGISLQLLENAITIFRALQKESVTLFFANKDIPLVMGELDLCEEKSIVRGVVIAPITPDK